MWLLFQGVYEQTLPHWDDTIIPSQLKFTGTQINVQAVTLLFPISERQPYLLEQRTDGLPGYEPYSTWSTHLQQN